MSEAHEQLSSSTPSPAGPGSPIPPRPAEAPNWVRTVSTVTGTAASLMAFVGLVAVMRATEGAVWVAVPPVATTPGATTPDLAALAGGPPAGPVTAGDAHRGQGVFASKVLNCSNCHTVNGQGGAVGPNLSGVALRFSREELRRKITEPSSRVREDYRQVQVQTGDGLTLAGIVKARTEDTMTLVDATGKVTKVELDDETQIKTSPLSLMPAGLAVLMSAQEFEDLLSYLETLRDPADPGRPAANIPAPPGKG